MDNKLSAALDKTRFCFEEVGFAEYGSDNVRVYFSGAAAAEVCVGGHSARFMDGYKERAREIPQFNILLAYLDRNFYKTNLPIQTSFGGGW